MASSSSSPSAAWSLAIKGDDGVWRLVPLYENPPAPGSLAIEATLCVSDRAAYMLALVGDAPCPQGMQVGLLVNGEERPHVSIGRPQSQEGRYLHELYCDGRERMTFGLTFGFVTVGVRLEAAGEGAVELATREIPCACGWPEQRTAVANMLAELAQADGQGPLAWMLGHGSAGAGASGLRDGGAQGGPRSLASFVELAERSLAVLEKQLPLFRARPLSRTLPAECEVPAGRVRRVGRSELAWMALNPECLAETGAPGGVGIGGRRYVPTSVRTALPQRSRANAENRAIVRFVAHIVACLAEAARALDAELARMRSVREALGGLPEADGLVPSLVVADVCLGLEEPLAARLVVLDGRAKRVLRAYEGALGAAPQDGFRLPRRSKAFQEIPHYVAVWLLMERWESFGPWRPGREALLLGTYRMDRLYEYYVLFALLRWLHRAGFAPDPGRGEEALASVAYAPDDGRFRNEELVANRYALARGDERVTLWYQPVVYGDMRSEGGIDLHRTTARRWFDEGSGDAYWTPDYLLAVEREGVSRRFVLDAKFSSLGNVGGFASAGGGGADALSIFEECLAKYRYAMARDGGGQIDGMWLLCGRVRRAELLPVCGSTWFAAAGLPMEDGLATVAPGADALDALFARLGIAGCDGGGT